MLSKQQCNTSGFVKLSDLEAGAVSKILKLYHVWMELKHK